MSDAGTLELLAEHLALAVSPLGDAVADEDAFRVFLRRLGWNARSLPPEWSALAADVDNVITGLEALQDAPGLDRALTLIGRVKSLYDAIGAIASAPAGVDPGAFLDKIGTRIVELLLVDYLTAAHPVAARLFRATHIITEAAQASAVGRPSFTETRFHFDEIPNVLADPLSIASRVYGWGTPNLDFSLVAEHLHELLIAFNLMSAVESVDSALADGLQAPRAQRQKSSNVQVRLEVVEIDVAGELVPVSIALLELPGEDTHLPGVILQPLIPPSAALDIPITSDWTVHIRAGSDIARTFGILIRPGDITVRYPFQPATTPPSAGFGAALEYHPSSPAVLLGKPGASRLELAGVQTGLALDFRGNDLEVALEGELRGLAVVLAIGEQDGFIGHLFRGTDIRLDVPLGVRWSNRRGFSFTGSAGFEITAAPHLSFGPITIDAVHLGFVASLASDRPATLSAVADISFSGALGPIGFAVQGIGVALDLGAADGNAGPIALEAGLRGPSGMGCVVDAGPITGGGFLDIDRASGRYSGILQLQLFGIGVTAIGILDTKLPGGQSGFAFLIIISVNFPPIQLGFGFTLNGVGGVAGINRTMVVEAIQAGIRAGSVDHIMFPEDPVRNAPQILSDLSSIFPPAEGRYVFGPMAMLGWGTPMLVRAEVGIILELPAPIRLAILGQLSIALPTEDAAIIELHIDVLGILDFEAKRLSVDASLHDSRIALFSIYGDMAFRLSWGDSPSFAFAIGGLHPRFQPPPGFPQLRRVTVSLGLDDNPRISIQGYLAVTSNSFQFGARAEMYAAAGELNMLGWIGFDVLFVFRPFHFEVDYSAGFAIRWGGETIAGMRVNGVLSGPRPWHVRGEACITIVFFDVCVGFDKTIGEEQPEPLPTADPWPALEVAIQDRRNWSAVLPPNVFRVVSLVPPDQTLVLLDPMGGAELREHVVPLNRPITRFGEATPLGPGVYRLSEVRIGARLASRWTTTTDFFARAQFEALSDAERVSIASFDRMDAGVALASGAVAAGTAWTTTLTYETRIVDSPWDGRVAADYTATLAQQHAHLRAGAAAREGVRFMGTNRFATGGESEPLLDDETYVVASTHDLRVRRELGTAMTRGDANLALKLHLATHPEDRDALQVLPLHEAAA